MAERPVVGDTYTASATFTVGGVATDPSTVTLVYTDPAGTATTVNTGSLTHPSTGVYTYNVSLTLAGTWTFVFTGTGAAAGVQDSTLNVYALEVVSSLYATVEEAKDWIRITDTTDDGTIAALLGAASRWIDSYCDRQNHGFWLAPTATASTYVPEGFWSVCVDDIGSSTGLTVKTDEDGDGIFETTWASSDYQLWDPNAPAMLPEAQPYTEIRAVGARLFPLRYPFVLGRQDKIQVTARWGWPQVPAAVKTACLIHTSRLLKRRESPEGIVGDPNFGVLRVSGKTDPDIAALLAPYRKNAALVG